MCIESRELLWTLRIDGSFETEFDALPALVQDKLLAQATVIGEFGPKAGRLHVDTLNGSKQANMDELRFGADDGVWRRAANFVRTLFTTL